MLCLLWEKPEFIYVYDDIEQRNYFSFYNYEYKLDVSRQKCIYPETIPLDIGLKEAARWYDEHEKEINKNHIFHISRQIFLNKIRKLPTQKITCILAIRFSQYFRKM